MVDETKHVPILVDVSADHKNLECGQSIGNGSFVCTLFLCTKFDENQNTRRIMQCCLVENRSIKKIRQILVT